MGIETKVLNTIKKYNLIEEGDSVVVGVSGGPDSVCLLNILHSLSAELCIKKLYALHINHMLRGEEAAQDEEYVLELCNELGVEVYSQAFDVSADARKRGISLEEAGREIRYRQFGLLADNKGAASIAVAHNKNDQAETVLLHIMRGAGLDGLRGMEYKRGRIIRPLLDVQRVEIEEYCKLKGLKPRTDSSNLENVYTRNRVRLDLIPYIDRLFKTDITSSLTRMASLLKDDNNYIEDNAINIYNQSIAKRDKHEVVLDTSVLGKQHDAIKKRVIRNAIREVRGSLKGIENIHIQDIIELMEKGRTGAEIHLPSNIRIQKSYGLIKVFLLNRENTGCSTFDNEVKIPGKTYIPGGAVLTASIEDIRRGEKYIGLDNNSLVQFFDYEKLDMGINIRNRREGDLFRPYRSNGTKKLKEYFIDNKIPREKRDHIPVVAKNNEIVWIIGYKISDKFKVTENTKSVLKLECTL